MPVEVTRLPDEPIVIATFTGHVDADDARRMFAWTVELTGDIEGRIYRITDASAATTDFRDLLRIVSEAGHSEPGSTSDPRIQPYLVGTDVMIRLLSQFLSQERYGKISMPLFKTLEDAIEAVRIQIHMSKRETRETGGL